MAESVAAAGVRSEADPRPVCVVVVEPDAAWRDVLDRATREPPLRVADGVPAEPARLASLAADAPVVWVATPALRGASSEALAGVFEAVWQANPCAEVVVRTSSDFCHEWVYEAAQARAGQVHVACPVRPSPAVLRWMLLAATCRWGERALAAGREEAVERVFGGEHPPLAHVARRFRDAIEMRRRAEVEERHAQKLEAVGRLAAGIAHEINTPMQFVGDGVDFLKEGFGDLNRMLEAWRSAALAHSDARQDAIARARDIEEEVDAELLGEDIEETFERIEEGVRRVADIVRAMREFAHPGADRFSPADINHILRNTATVARNEYKYVADLEMELGDIPPVECHAGDLGQVFLNLLVNAAHAIADRYGDSGQRGTIRICTAVSDGGVVVSIADDGCGIAPEVADRIFDPFFTTKEVGRGTGQGLAIARTIVVDRHGGRIEFDTKPGEGTTFHVWLPLEARRT